MNNLKDLQNILNYNFNNISLLEEALTHKSYANEFMTESYERLEFLGDAIIEFVVSDTIVNYKELGAGELSKLRASLVSTSYLYNISINLGLDKLAKKSKSLPSLSKKNTADLFESVVGAVYLDGGLQKAKDIIDKYIIINEKNITNVLEKSRDYKTLLQELLQSKAITFKYDVIKTTGKDHNKTFYVKLTVGDDIVTGMGLSIQSAEEDCAKKYLEKIK